MCPRIRARLFQKLAHWVAQLQSLILHHIPPSRERSTCPRIKAYSSPQTMVLAFPSCLPVLRLHSKFHWVCPLRAPPGTYTHLAMDPMATSCMPQLTMVPPGQTFKAARGSDPSVGASWQAAATQQAKCMWDRVSAAVYTMPPAR